MLPIKFLPDRQVVAAHSPTGPTLNQHAFPAKVRELRDWNHFWKRHYSTSCRFAPRKRRVTTFAYLGLCLGCETAESQKFYLRERPTRFGQDSGRFCAERYNSAVGIQTECDD